MGGPTNRGLALRGSTRHGPGRRTLPRRPRRHRLHQQEPSRAVAGLLGRDYSSSQMSYDLRRLRLHGLIERIPGTNSYVLTSEGIRVAVFYTKLQARLLRPLLESDKPPPPIELRRALGTIDHVLG